MTTEKTEQGGICSLDQDDVWGDMVIIYGSNLYDAHTYPHELGHSFGLPHTFSSSIQVNPYHQFCWGYTENYMDYESTEDGKVGNPFHRGANSVFTF